MSVRAFAGAANRLRGGGNCIAGEMPGAAVARNLREIVSPDLPNERHRDFVNHSCGVAGEEERVSSGRSRRRA